MPQEVLKPLTSGTDIFGDFIVCPFTKQKEGHMQMICVESARNLVIQRHRQGERSEIIVINE
jgi:hypothetical protein